ncbi:uncharacterized protein LTR77_004313 [Saxophila tyrrhenica]|uniref:Zn(2)-C6 fungal-type domain-containing protein n=1 Tax=Saxophila tyrrhenica TaxID=1690608 RepID=A0AAV9PCB3_9PEZI|nr:hypothetical protein LTR77_004313 [Saxophila tyrrhenica]
MNSPTDPKSGIPARADTKDSEAWSGDDGTEDGGDGRERKRRRPMSVSCETCKGRKVKCDRGQPNCGWCVRNNAVCEYKERKKPGLRAGYGRELEARLDELETEQHDQRQLLQQLLDKVRDANTPKMQTRPGLQSRQPSQVEAALYMQAPSNRYAQPTIDNTARDLRTPSVSDLNQNQQPPGFLRHPSQPNVHIPTSVPANDGYTAADPPVESPSLNIEPAGRANSNASEAASFASGPHDLPPYDLLYALTELFFVHVNTWCPILHRRTTIESLFGSTMLEEADRVLLHAIVATTLRFSNDPRLDGGNRERYHEGSKQRVLLYGLENSSVKALQALTILTLDVTGSSNGPPGWNLLALITRSVVQLGLSTESSAASTVPVYPSIYTLRAMVLPEPKSWVEDETRRRLLWAIYILDRYTTVATAFEFCLNEKEIDRKLPCHEELWERNEPTDTKWFRLSGQPKGPTSKPTNLGSFSYYVEIIGILSQIHQFLKKPVDISALPDIERWQQEYRTLDSRLSDWKFSLPDEYGNMGRIYVLDARKQTADSMWIMLQITYQTALIRLHSSAAYPTTRSPIFTPSFSASQRCHGAAEQICELCKYVRHREILTQLGPTFAFSLWVAARLLLVHGSTIDHKVNPAITLLVQTLHEMGRYWKVAERYATLLQRVLDEYHESVKSPVGPGGVRETPSTVRILSDMRRTAFDLDFLISRQPKQNFPSKVSSATPARTPTRTPAPEELEYLDVFDFFNMPRLPFPGNGEAAFGAAGYGGEPAAMEYPAMNGNGNEFNIQNFMYDANSDWFTNPS